MSHSSSLPPPTSHLTVGERVKRRQRSLSSCSAVKWSGWRQSELSTAPKGRLPAFAEGKRLFTYHAHLRFPCARLLAIFNGAGILRARSSALSKASPCTLRRESGRREYEWCCRRIEFVEVARNDCNSADAIIALLSAQCA
jgi:hypothetical protein